MEGDRAMVMLGETEVQRLVLVVLGKEGESMLGRDEDVNNPATPHSATSERNRTHQQYVSHNIHDMTELPITKHSQ